MNISPNPSKGLFTVQVNGLDDKGARMTILDITGRKIEQKDIDPADVQDVKFDLSGYPKGIYLVSLQSDTESLVKKLILK